MHDFSILSKISLYVILAFMAFISMVVMWWQINVLKGKEMKNPDGSSDSITEHKIFYGIAAADIFMAVPVTLAGIVFIFINFNIGNFLLILASFWYVWANAVFTITSLRFEKPKITAEWLITYPLGVLIGLAYIVWVVLHFSRIFVI